MAVISITAGGAFEAFGAAAPILGAGSTIATRKDEQIPTSTGLFGRPEPGCDLQGLRPDSQQGFVISAGRYSLNVIRHPSLQAEGCAP
jgi:hypothetical protein